MNIFFNQNNRFKSGIYVYVLLIASIIIIFMTGLISYNKISHSLSNLNNRFNEDFELRSIKDIRLDYAKLDNMMEMYLITHQQFYITQLDSTAEGTRQMIAKLKTSKKISRYEVRHIDSLKLLLNNK